MYGSKEKASLSKTKTPAEYLIPVDEDVYLKQRLTNKDKQ